MMLSFTKLRALTLIDQGVSAIQFFRHKKAQKTQNEFRAFGAPCPAINRHVHLRNLY